MRGFESAQGLVGLVEIDFRITLVGRDDEAEAVGKFEQCAPDVKRQHLPRRVAGRADVEQLHAGPFVGAERIQVEIEVARRQRIQKRRLGSGQQGGTFIDLVEGIRARHQRVSFAAVDDCLGKRE